MNQNDKVVENLLEMSNKLSGPLVELLKPPFKVLGEGIESIIKIVFCPFNIIGDKIDSIRKFKKNIADSINRINEEDFICPELNKIGPVLEASKFYVENEILSKMFANLLASLCNKMKKNIAHVSFVEVIKQLSPEEAYLLVDLYVNRNEYGCVNLIKKQSINDYDGVINRYIPSKYVDENYFIDKETYGLYIDNLCRLSLIEFTDEMFSEDYKYDNFERTRLFKECKNLYNEKLDMIKCYWEFTTFGLLFTQICLDITTDY